MVENDENGTNDFLPEIRRTAIWASDARKIASGKVAEVYLEKIGRFVPEDISHIEAVQWGHRMQRVIRSALSEKLHINIKDLDISSTHRVHPWMKSHFDAISENNKTLFEIKNYSAHSRNKFGDDGSSEVPIADYAQCVHEAAVFGISDIRLAVLFGGQELCVFPLNITDEEKEALILQEASLWASVQTETPPDTRNSEDLSKLFPQSTSRLVRATNQLTAIVQELKNLKQNIAALEERESTLTGIIKSAMLDADTLVGPNNERLATWKSSKATTKFDQQAFESAMPDVYKNFVREFPGSRRFLIK